MRSQLRASRRALALLSFAVVLGSCGDKIAAPLPRVHKLEAHPNPATVRVDETLVMVLTMAADSGADLGIIWESADPRRVSVTETGILTGISVGPAVVTVRSADNPEAVAIIPVTVTPAYTGVRGITASPLALSLLPGQTQGISVSVDADSKVSRDVRYEIDSASVASVSASGIVAAIAPGVAHVTVRSVADPSMKTIVAVVVRSPTSARVSLQALTAAGTTNPVNLQNVTGQVDAIINIEPGERPLERVNLVVTNNARDTIVASQTFTTAQALALEEKLAARAAQRASGVGTPVAVAPIVLSFRTDAFDGTTGLTAFRNGSTTIKVVAINSGAGAGQQTDASSSVAALLNNLDGFLVSVRGLSNTGVASANDANGRRWFQAGRGLLFTSVPVSYSGRALGARTISFPGNTPVASVTSAATGASSDTLVLPAGYASTTTGDGYVNGELPSIAAADVGGNTLRLTPAVTASGSGAGVINAQPGYLNGARLDGIRVDNSPPPAATLIISATAQNSNNWINGAYQFTSGFAGLAADAGVGLAGSATAPTPTTANVTFLAVGGGLTDTTQVTSGAQLPSSNTNATYTIIARYADRLGNTRNVQLSGSGPNPKATFGVDLQPPTVRYPQNALVGETLVSTGADSVFSSLTGTTGPLAFAIDAIDDRSGLAPGRVGVTITRFSQPNPAGSFAGTTTCVVGVNGVCGPAYSNYETVLPDSYCQYTVVMDGGSGIQGYYTFTATVQDQAGNTSTQIIKRALYDVGTGGSAPQMTGLGISGVLAGGQAANFVALAVDNVELARGGLFVGYPNLPGASQMLAFGTPSSGGTTIGRAFDETLTSPVAGAHKAFSIPLFIRGIESVDGNNAPQAYPAATAKPNAMNGWVTDFAPGGVISTLPANVAIAGSSVQSPASPAGFIAGVGTANELQLWRQVPGSVLSFEAVGPSGQSVSPFDHVVLARLEPTGLTPNANVWRVVSELTAPLGTDNGLRRAWTYEFGAQSSGDYVALGVSATGDAIVTRIVTIP
jgi:hypothetical protein